MPYIARSDRSKYNPVIENTVAQICEEVDDIVRGEYVGFFLEVLVASSFDLGGVDHNSFSLLELDKRQHLSANAEKLSRLIFSNSDLFKQAGELNYCMSAVLWGVLGDSLHAKPARYGFRAFVKGFLWSLYHRMNTWPMINSEIGATRKARIVQGVITDVIDEMYRRKTAIYEDQKIEEQGDVWPLKQVQWVETVPIDMSVSPDNFEE